MPIDIRARWKEQIFSFIQRFNHLAALSCRSDQARHFSRFLDKYPWSVADFHKFHTLALSNLLDIKRERVGRNWAIPSSESSCCLLKVNHDGRLPFHRVSPLKLTSTFRHSFGWSC